MLICLDFGRNGIYDIKNKRYNICSADVGKEIVSNGCFAFVICLRSKVDVCVRASEYGLRC